MDCRTAQATLDAGRPDRSDWDAPELRAASEHVESCLDCQTLLAGRSRWDETLAESFHEVPLPAGLESRLLAALAGDLLPEIRHEARGRPSRRRLARWAAAIVAILLAVVAWRMPWGAAAQLSLEDVYAQVLAGLPAAQEVSITERPTPFDGAFDAAVTDAVWKESLAQSPPLGLDLDGHAGADAAAYRFNAGRVSGWLVVLPKSRVPDAPTATVPLHQHSRYAPRPHVAWTRGEQLFVCVLERGSLDDLQREFYGAAA